MRNNPLNIRASQAFSWVGQSGAEKGFCVFDDVEFCRRAGAYLLMRSYRRAGCDTIEKIIRRWAPPLENPTSTYIAFVAKMSSLKPDTHLCFISDYAAILAAMEIFEQGIISPRRDTYYCNARNSYTYIISKFKISTHEKES